MAISKKSQIVIGILSAAAVGGTALFLAQPRPKKKKTIAKKPCPPGEVEIGTDSSGHTMCAPANLGDQPKPDLDLSNTTILASIRQSKDEPLGGWQARWDQRSDQAIAWCRSQARTINGWTAFWNCALERAFPEAASYASDDKPPWWNDAAQYARADLIEFIKKEGAGTQGWRFFLWLKFDAYIADCYEALAPHSSSIAHCIASEIYPKEAWSPSPKSGWKFEFWNALLEKIDKYEESESGLDLSVASLNHQQ